MRGDVTRVGELVGVGPGRSRGERVIHDSESYKVHFRVSVYDARMGLLAETPTSGYLGAPWPSRRPSGSQPAICDAMAQSPPREARAGYVDITPSNIVGTRAANPQEHRLAQPDHAPTQAITMLECARNVHPSLITCRVISHGHLRVPPLAAASALLTTQRPPQCETAMGACRRGRWSRPISLRCRRRWQARQAG